MDNMDRLLQSVADEANGHVPYAHMQRTILDRAKAKRIRQNNMLRYGSMAAAFVVLVGIGVLFLNGGSAKHAYDMSPLRASYTDKSAESDGDLSLNFTSDLDRDYNPEAVPAPEAATYANGVQDNGKAAANTEYIGEPLFLVMTSFDADSFGAELEDIIADEICVRDDSVRAPEIVVEVINKPHPFLDVGWAMINALDANAYIATWRVSDGQYVEITFPDKYDLEQIMSFLKAMVG